MQLYRAARNKVTYLINKAKREYYYKRIASNPNPSDLWATLKTVLPSKQCRSKVPSDLNAEHFNQYFSSIGEKVTSTLSHHNSSNYIVSNQPDNTINTEPIKFKFLQIPSTDVYTKLLRLSGTTSLDVLELDTYLLKLAAHLIAPSLSHVFNLSLYQGVLPDDFKFARITPVFKNKGNLSDVSNYRPISVISHISKILESLVKKQLLSHLINGKHLSSNQFAYIKGRSTQLALHKIIDNWLENIDKGLITGACYLDLSKCFDTVSHPTLLKKLCTFGIFDTELNWFKSYLNNRHQVVKLNGTTSKPLRLPIGVPQGTILGPILFILYANDIHNFISVGTCIMYADDITLYVSAPSLREVESKLQTCIDDTLSWLKCNKLVVNATKSNSMLIGSRQKITNLSLNLLIDKDVIEFTKEYRLLGLKIDSNLTWKSQTLHVAKKISSKIAIIKRLKSILPQNILKFLYFPFLQSNVDYCLTIWGHSANKYIQQIQKLQNRAARIITNNFNREISSTSLCSKLGWMSVNQRLRYLTGCFMFKCLHDNNSIVNFAKASQHHNYVTRFASNGKLTLLKPHTSYYKNSISYYGPFLWNSIPNFIRNIANIQSFKNQYKIFIFNSIE